MKILITILFLAFLQDGLTPEEKIDQMRPKGMIRVGSEGRHTFKITTPDGSTTRYYYIANGVKAMVGWRFYLQGDNSYRYYWVPKFCGCSQERRIVDEEL